MKILILSWKDITHPYAGGAEKVTHEFAQRLVAKGHDITLLTTKTNLQSNYETINHITILRAGNLFSLYLYIPFFWFKNKNNFDLVIDQIHGIPFMTPLFVKKKIVALIFEVADTIWDFEFSKPIAYIGKCIEKFSLQFYKQTQFLTMCSSTQNELMSYGIQKQKISLIGPGIIQKRVTKIQKNKTPLFVYVGRLSRMKQTHWLIETAQILKDQKIDFKIIIAGVGKTKFVNNLNQKIHEYSLEKQVILLGFISETEKVKLYQKAWAALHPSIKEGYGLTVVEAAQYKTPTICFNVPGLRDLVKNKHNGFVLKNESPHELVKTLEKIMKYPSELLTVQENAYQWTKSLPSWEKQTMQLEKLFN